MSSKKTRQHGCGDHPDCFANVDNICVCLLDTDFGGKPCPFYKCNTKITIEKIIRDCKSYADYGFYDLKGGAL